MAKIKTIENDILKSYVGKKVFVTRDRHSLDCGIFTDKNLCGYGKGIRGDFWNDDISFKQALSETGDYLNRRIFTIDTLNDLKKYLNLDTDSSDDYLKSYIKDLIIKTRNSYCSANPEKERAENVYVEIEDLF